EDRSPRSAGWWPAAVSKPRTMDSACDPGSGLDFLPPMAKQTDCWDQSPARDGRKDCGGRPFAVGASVAGERVSNLRELGANGIGKLLRKLLLALLADI